MVIRKATLNDAQAVATCLLLAMKSIIYKLIGEEDPENAKAFLLYFAARENNQYSYQNCWIAEVENEVVAAVNVYDGAKLHPLRQPVLEYIKTNYGGNITPEDETHAGEYYIDSLGVNPNHQGKSIGTQLLQFLIEEYVTKRGETLGLLVDEENGSAKRLYLKLGFTSAGHKMLLGKRMEHLQIAG